MIDNTQSHDPSEYIRGLQQLLVSDKKRIAFLFGAGTSLAKKTNTSLTIPAIGRMTTDIVLSLSERKELKDALLEIKEEIGEDKFTVETLLSNIEQKLQIIGSGTLNKLNKNDFQSLNKEVKNQIRAIVSIHEKIDNDMSNVIHVDFAEWIGKADRKYPVEIFTTNYDYLFELGLEHKNIPYYDGFTGSYKPFFNAESVDDLSFLPNQTKLWKIHGSLGWHFDEISKKVWRKDSTSDEVLIYPSTLKYNNSKKQPYSALGDRLTNFLKQPDTILITCGYSFGDEHINERITTALKSNALAHVYVLNYDVLWNNEGRKQGYAFDKESDLAKLAIANTKISIFSGTSAVIGGQYGIWKLKREPDKDDTINVNLYFKENGHSNLSEELNEEKTGTEDWNGEGELVLPDFADFVKFVQSMMYSPPNKEHNKNG